MNRREALAATAAAATVAGLAAVAVGQDKDAPVKAGDPLKITKLETFLVQPRWLFLKVHTNAGLVGLGEPVVEGRAETVQTAVKEIEPYLVGKDPRQVTHHWQAIYRHAFYRGGPVLTSALSGIDMALWDIKGKALGVPVYELLGGPTRSKVRLYLAVRTPAELKKGVAAGFTAFKTNVAFKRKYPRYVETPSQVGYAVEQFAALRKEGGDDVDVAIDYHGKVSPALAKVLIKGMEPHLPMFVEEPINCQNHDLMAEIARSTHLPIATGERVFTKWGFREVLEKKAATVLQPDLCHAGGITEVRLIAGMAEAYYASIAPHNPLGPISLAAGIQLAAAIPNFLCQEHRTLGEGYLKKPFVLKEGFVDVPTGPGLGIELDENAVANKVGHQWRSTESYDEDDGSVVDW
jgi:galactonate dehydratase